MAVASIAVPPDAKRDEKAAKMVDAVATWPKHTLKVAWGSFEAGTMFRRAYGSNGARYLVNAVACECPDYAEWGHVCKHIRAIVLWEARQQAASQPVPAPRRRYADLFPTCTRCGDAADRPGLCYDCLANEAYRERLASKRATPRELVTV